MTDITQDVVQACEPLANVDRPWYVCGGWAIDLLIGRQTRPHRDTDIAVARRDQLVFQQHLLRSGWLMQSIESGRPSSWAEGQIIDPPTHEVWAVRGGQRLELLLNEIEDEVFSFRRDPAMTMALQDAWFDVGAGLRVLASEIVLLYKATQPDQAENRHDFGVAMPKMCEASKAWLRDGLARLDADHPWLKAIG